MYKTYSTVIDSFNPKIVDLPYGDKSITHRALICAALSDGKCIIRNSAINSDIYTTAGCLQKLGAKIEYVDGNSIMVIPFKKPNTDVVLDCENSGTTARLLAGVVAGLGIHATFIGDDSLSSRPMDRIITPLRLMGAKIEQSENCLFEIFPSELVGIEYDIPIPSAQVKSAILFAGLFAQGNTVVRESITTRDHTENCFYEFGVKIKREPKRTEITPRYPLRSVDVFEIPNDFSTAAFLIALKIKEGITLKNVGLNPTRTGFLKWLSDFGAQVEVFDQRKINGELVGTIEVSGGEFKPVTILQKRVTEMIDEIPVCCLLSALAVGESKFRGLNELAVKESNRIIAIKNLLQDFGVEVKDIKNGLSIKGTGKLICGQAPCTKDHRIAMLGVVAGAHCGKFILPTNPDCIAISCPNFFQLLGFPFQCGLIGSDVKNSLSPKVYSALTKATGIEINYQLYNIPEDEFDKTHKELTSKLYGTNFTMPYKTKLISKYIPVNTLKRVGKNHIFYNTDGYGIIFGLRQNGFKPANKTYLILGCGGTAIEAIRILVKFGANVLVRNRTAHKVEELSRYYPIEKRHFGHFDGIFSFLPPTKELSLVSEEEIELTDFIFDACYIAETPITATAKKLNKKIIDGKTMLFGQGLKNFEIWTGKALSEEEVAFAQYEFIKETTK